MAQSLGLFWVIKKYDVDPELILLILARATQIKFSVVHKPSRIPFSFKDSITSNLRATEDPGWTSITHLAVPVCYWYE